MINVTAPAKINLFLDILGRLENGFHSLFMVMQTVDLCDEITVDKGNGGISLTCFDERLPQDERNIAYKAAAAFFKATGIEPNAVITVTKKIPFEAGLAGGSADAAAVIVGLNKLYGTELSTQAMCEIGLTVGSDVPFCIKGGTCIAQNRGEVLSEVKPLKECFIVIAKPEKGVSTAQAFAAADSTHIYHPDNLRMLDACSRGDFNAICKHASNVFEQVIEVVERIEIKDVMRSCGALLYQMSGSGPSVFGIFDSKEEAEKCVRELKKSYKDVFLTSPVNYGAKTI